MIGLSFQADKGGTMTEYGTISYVKNADGEMLRVISVTKTDGTVIEVSFKCRYTAQVVMNVACAETEH